MDKKKTTPPKKPKPSQFGLFIQITFIHSFNRLLQRHNKRKLHKLIKKQDKKQLDLIK